MKIKTGIRTLPAGFTRSNWGLPILACVYLSGLVLVNAGTFSTDFNSGAPAAASVTGTAVVDSMGGVGDSGVLKLTTADNDQQGSFLIDDLDGGAVVSGFTATFKLLIGGGNGADGFSFNFANDLADVFGEEGSGKGFTAAFDIYDNGGGEAPAIDLKNGGVVMASTKGVGSLLIQNKFVDVRIKVNTDGTLNLSMDNQVIYTNFYGAFTPTAGRFGLGARTGGLNENQFVDDLSITTSTNPPTQPAHPLVTSVSPTGGGINPDSVIKIQVKDFATQLNANAVTLLLNGTSVSPTVTKAGGLTTIQYDPPGLLPSGSSNTFTLIYRDNGSPASSTTNQWSFAVSIATTSPEARILGVATDPYGNIDLFFERQPNPASATNSSNYTVTGPPQLQIVKAVSVGLAVKLVLQPPLGEGTNATLLVQGITALDGTKFGSLSNVVLTGRSIRPNGKISIAKAGNDLVLTWAPADAALLHSAKMPAQWQFVGDATNRVTSPYTNKLNSYFGSAGAYVIPTSYSVTGLDTCYFVYFSESGGIYTSPGAPTTSITSMVHYSFDTTAVSFSFPLMQLGLPFSPFSYRVPEWSTLAQFICQQVQALIPSVTLVYCFPNLVCVTASGAVPSTLTWNYIGP
jgi:hypothetical protein